jgi:hypothetical protein
VTGPTRTIWTVTTSWTCLKEKDRRIVTRSGTLAGLIWEPCTSTTSSSSFPAALWLARGKDHHRHAYHRESPPGPPSSGRRLFAARLRTPAAGATATISLPGNSGASSWSCSMWESWRRQPSSFRRCRHRPVSILRP